MDVSQLPQDIQNAIDPQFAGANNGPVIPGTNMPLPPNSAQNTQAAQPAPVAPDLGAPNAPGSLADKISKAFLEHLAANQPQRPQQQPQPSTGQKIVNGAEGVMTALGDAAHSSDRPGGWLSGVTNVLNARNQRQSGEAQQRFQNEQEAQKTQALVARNQVETVALQRNIHRQDQELREASYKQGAAFTESQRARHDVQDGISQNELTALVKNNPNYLTTHYAKQTSEEAVYDGDGTPMVDSQGNPVMSPIYSLITRATKDGSPNVHTITPEDHDFILKNTGQDIPVNTQYPFDSWMSTNTTALANHNTVAMVNKSREEDMTAEQQRQVQTELADPGVQHAIASVPGKPLGGLYQFQQNADQHLAAIKAQLGTAQQKGDQAAVQQLQQQAQQIQDERKKIDHVVDFGFSTEDKRKFAEDQEKERHDRADEAAKQQEIADKKSATAKFQGNPNLQGPAFLASLQPDEAAVVKQIGTGQMPVTRLDFLAARNPALLSAVAQAYPDFDGSKVQAYTHTYKDFTSGPTSKALNAGSTALEHLQRLYDNTTAGSLIPGSKAARQRENDLINVSAEVARFLNGGTAAPSEKEIEAVKKSLDPTLPFNRRSAIAEETRLIKDKLNNYETQWQNAAPSKAYQAPMPGISPASKRAAEYILNDGKIPQQPQAQLPPAAVQQLKEGVHTTFANGQTWTLQGGKPVQVQGQQ